MAGRTIRARAACAVAWSIAWQGGCTDAKDGGDDPGYPSDATDAPQPIPPTPTPTPPPTPTTPTPTTPTAVDPCTLDAVDPGGPVPPATIGTLTVTASTALGGGTDDDTLALCLTATRCFPLAQGDGTPTGDGGTSAWMFEAVGLPRADVDRVELRVGDGDEPWRPGRLDVRFDGEPVYCADLEAAGVVLGSGGGEVDVWTDPALHEDCVSAWEAALTHGPMVGAVGATAANLWIRADATRPVYAEVWPTTDPGAARIAGWAYPRAEDDFTATIAAGCLAASTSYTYQVWVDGAPTGWPGTFTTAPTDGTPSAWTFAFGSCAKTDQQPIFSAIAADAPDLFAFVGDAHYGNTADLDASRWFYRAGLARFDRAVLSRFVPTLAVWDDHDYVGDDTDGSAPGKENVLRSFREYWANPEEGAPGADGVFFLHRRGDVDLLFLDDRYQRALDGTLLGVGQHQWLVDQLTASIATFKLVIDGSQWSFANGGDSWVEYPDEREELFELVADARIDGVVLLSGDVHRAELRQLDAPGYPIPELTSSPLAQDEPSPCEGSDDELIACRGDGNSYVTVDIDTTVADPTLTATIHAEDGAPLDAYTWALSALTVP